MDRVIEAAAKADYDLARSSRINDSNPATWEALSPMIQRAHLRRAEVVVRAADAARAEDVKAAVERVIDVCTDDDDEFGLVDGEYVSRIEHATAHLYRLLNIPEES